MTKAQQRAFNQKRSKELSKSMRDSLAETRRSNKRINDMLKQVKTYRAPSSHVGLRDFMIQQLETSLSSVDYYLKELAKEVVTDHYCVALESARSDIEYHTKEYLEEVKRTEERNLWIKQLFDSLPSA